MPFDEGMRPGEAARLKVLTADEAAAAIGA
jgi:hypothetical protein